MITSSMSAQRLFSAQIATAPAARLIPFMAVEDHLIPLLYFFTRLRGDFRLSTTFWNLATTLVLSLDPKFLVENVGLK